MTTTKDNIAEAHRILDGVVAISENEQLIHSEYVTNYVVDPELRKAGAICGGRQACLIGSVAIAAVQPRKRGWKPVQTLIDVLILAPKSEAALLLGSSRRIRAAKKSLARRPALKLAIDALNAEATERLERVRSVRKQEAQDALDWANAAEGFFESYLYGLSTKATHKQIVALVEGAKARIG